MKKIEDLVDLSSTTLHKEIDAIDVELNESFEKYGNQILLQEEFDLNKKICEDYDLTLEDNKNDVLIKEVLLKQELLIIQKREVENLTTISL